MAALVIKDLPDELHRRLKEQASLNHRSMAKEAVALLEAGLEQGRMVYEAPAPYRPKRPISQAQLDRMRRQGRK